MIANRAERERVSQQSRAASTVLNTFNPVSCLRNYVEFLRFQPAALPSIGPMKQAFGEMYKGAATGCAAQSALNLRFEATGNCPSCPYCSAGVSSGCERW